MSFREKFGLGPSRSDLFDLLSSKDEEIRNLNEAVDFHRSVNMIAIDSLMRERGRLEFSKNHQHIDEQTGFLTKLGLQKEFILRSQIKKPTGVLFMDIDNFKSVNDQLGHVKADAVIQRFAECVRGHLRDSDIIGRWGGHSDEVVVLLPGTNHDDSLIAAEKLRKTIDESTFGVNGDEVELTVSIGVGNISPFETFDETMEKTNEAMFQAKRSGKNQVVPIS